MDNESTFYEDKELNCSDCQNPFTFTGGEQRFFAEREFTPPKRCKPCRDQRKAQRDNGGSHREQERQATDWGEPAEDNRSRSQRRRHRS